MSINICSLMSKHDNLVQIVNNIISNNVNLKIIALQEIWQVPHPDLVKIPGFNLFMKTRSLTTGGGVAFFVKDNIHCKILEKHSSFIEKDFECLTVEIILNRKKIILSNIYRSPTSHSNLSQQDYIEQYINMLDNHLFNLTLCNQDTYVFADSNINLLKLNHNQNVALYLETIFSNGYCQNVGKATRIAGNSYSLIDHILTKTANISGTSGTIVSDLSDHFANFIVIPDTEKKQKNIVRTTRNFSLTSLNNFKDSLSCCSWNNVIENNDVNASYEIFKEDFFYTI